MVLSPAPDAGFESAFERLPRPERGEGTMLNYIRILGYCTLAGYLLAMVFMTPGGASMGAAKGLLVGVLVAWGEWKSKQNKQVAMRRSGVV